MGFLLAFYRITFACRTFSSSSPLRYLGTYAQVPLDCPAQLPIASDALFFAVVVVVVAQVPRYLRPGTSIAQPSSQ